MSHQDKAQGMKRRRENLLVAGNATKMAARRKKPKLLSARGMKRRRENLLSAGNATKPKGCSIPGRKKAQLGSRGSQRGEEFPQCDSAGPEQQQSRQSRSAIVAGMFLSQQPRALSPGPAAGNPSRTLSPQKCHCHCLGAQLGYL